MAEWVRVRLGFRNASDEQIAAKASAVVAGMTGNPSFPIPRVKLEDVQSALDRFVETVAAKSQGGQATARRNNARRDLIGLLRILSHQVDLDCGDNLAVLLSSGFQARSTNIAKSPLPKPDILSLDNGRSTELLVRVKTIRNAKCYEVRYAEHATDGSLGPWQTHSLRSNSRSMLVDGLTPGTTYSIKVRAVGGSTGCSDWSDPVSHMCA